MKRLSLSEMEALPHTVQRPRYDPTAIKAGIVHLGIGAFHRAHQAVYTDDVLNMGQKDVKHGEAKHGNDWAIIGISLRRSDVRDQLQPQDNLYTVLEMDGDSRKTRLIGAIKQVLHAPENPAKVIGIVANAQIKIVSLTVTEKGYYLDPATGMLQIDHPDIQYDLKNPNSPKTIYGYLVAALNIRCKQGQALTIMSCDNLSDNSTVLKASLLSYGAVACPEIVPWIEEYCRFPCTMVDRMVPATTKADRQAHRKTINMDDQALVICEPFRQWVIEDKFATGRPAWEKAGALMVSTAGPYETIKLRLLNGTHSALAYLGFLAGYEYIFQASQDEILRSFVEKLMDTEITASLTVPQNLDITEYKKTILTRFSNPSVKYTTAQVATDGSQKLPQRWLNTLQYQLDHGGKHDLLCLGIASWIRYLQGVDENGLPYSYNDPLQESLYTIVSDKNSSPYQIVTNILSVQAVFGGHLYQNTLLIAQIAHWLESLNKQGALKTIQQVLTQSSSI